MTTDNNAFDQLSKTLVKLGYHKHADASDYFDGFNEGQKTMKERITKQLDILKEIGEKIEKVGELCIQFNKIQIKGEK